MGSEQGLYSSGMATMSFKPGSRPVCLGEFCTSQGVPLRFGYVLWGSSLDILEDKVSWARAAWTVTAGGLHSVGGVVLMWSWDPSSARLICHSAAPPPYCYRSWPILSLPVLCPCYVVTCVNFL